MHGGKERESPVNPPGIRKHNAPASTGLGILLARFRIDAGVNARSPEDPWEREYKVPSIGQAIRFRRWGSLETAPLWVRLASRRSVAASSPNAWPESLP